MAECGRNPGLAALPLVLVPTYLVPTLLILHLTALLQARRLGRQTTRYGKSGASGRSESRKPLEASKMVLSVPLFALAPTEAPGWEVSIVAISETVLVLAGGTAVLSILFGMRLAMRAVAGGAAAPRSNGGQAAGGSGAPDVAGVIALPP